MKTIEELKEELSELEGGRKQTETSEADQIADDDPDLARYMTRPESKMAELFPDLFSTSAPTLTGAKRALAEQRRRDNLVTTIGDESRPWDERIQAARELWNEQNYWDKTTEKERVEWYTPHPDAARLKELCEFTWDETPAGADWYEHNRTSVGSDWQEYIRKRHVAYEEFERLRKLFPQRQVKLACNPVGVACRIIIALGIDGSMDSRFYEVFDFVRDLTQSSKSGP